MDYAYNNVSFYKERFDQAGIKPADIKDREDLLKIPVLNKTDLRRAGRRIIADGLKPAKLKYSTSSGSTGQPTNSYFTFRDHLLLRYLLKFRSKWICGLRLRHRVILVSSNPVEKVQQENEKIINKILRKKSISINESLDRHLHAYRMHHPDVMYGTISYFNELKDYVARHNVSWLKPKIIFSSGEIFDPETKHEIEQVFQCPVYDIYGSTEMKEVSWECPCGAGYHINEDAYFLELVDGRRHVGEKEEGRIIITSLVNRGMPLIRYDLGDKGISMNGRCRDGVKFALMRPVTGRAVDYFCLPDGKKIAPFTLIVALHDYASHCISQFQIVQKEPDRVLIKIKPGENFSAETAENIRRIYQNLMGRDIEIEIQMVQVIEREKSGKFQLVKSECNRM